MLAAACQGSGPRPEPGASSASGAPSTSSASAVAPAAPASSVAPGPTLPLHGVILLSVDSLRADLSWCAGYARSTTPTLAGLAERGVVYTHAYALSSYTSMSFGGAMTGRYPSELHRDGLATSSFFDDETFLAEELKRARVRTMGAFGHVWFAGATGIRQGFDEWALVPHTITAEQSKGFVTDDVIAQLLGDAIAKHHESRASEPFFAWAHFMDPHWSYERHAGTPGFSSKDDGGPESPLAPGVKLTPYAQQRRDRYDGEVAFTDAQIGKLLARFTRETWWPRVAVIVTADHGEAFGEHGSYYEHGFLLHDVTTRVPLLFSVPGVTAARFDDRRSQIDLARTVAELLGVELGPSFRGQSLVPELRGAERAARDVMFDMPYTDQAPRRRALIHGQHKIVVSAGAVRPTLFDLDADPGEATDLAATRPDLLAEMQKRYDDANAAHPDYPAPRRKSRSY